MVEFIKHLIVLDIFDVNLFSRSNQFHGEKKFGGQYLISEFQRKLEEDIENKYNDLKQQNEQKKVQFEMSFDTYTINKYFNL